MTAINLSLEFGQTSLLMHPTSRSRTTYTIETMSSMKVLWRTQRAYSKTLLVQAAPTSIVTHLLGSSTTSVAEDAPPNLKTSSMKIAALKSTTAEFPALSNQARSRCWDTNPPTARLTMDWYPPPSDWQQWLRTSNHRPHLNWRMMERCRDDTAFRKTSSKLKRMKSFEEERRL